MNLTTEPLVVQQQSSSVSSDLVSKFINPSPDTGIDSILNPNVQSDIPVNVSVSTTTKTPSSDTTIPQPPIPIIQPRQQTHDSTTTTNLPKIPNFASLFALSSIPGIVDNYLASMMKDAVNVVVQLKSNKLREEAQAENDKFLKQIDLNIKDIIKDQEIRQGRVIKEATQKESKSTSSSKGASRSQPKSSGKFAQAEEHGPRVDDLEEPLHQEFNTRNDDVSPLAQASGTQSLFNEFLATPIDFSAFIMNRLKINNLTQDVLTCPTYDLMKGTCKSVVELEYHLEEVFKATHDQLDWRNPKGRSSLSQRYTTLITKTKAAEYSHVKWIEDKVPRSIWSSVQVIYDKHAYWGTYHWGPKRQSFYGYDTNMETSKYVYSRHRIIVVASLKIMEFFSYKHLEEIIVRR
ncbi:hypothetical protein Tco_1575288 [Tanacetum coccineum]